ncbi:hypothetical protein TEA_018964 [Camellia sinensis var. sinensis]|uniref:X8 domain-containing protein n=1 Tax=Camellia sinensis var. sinensis TaxID=542762 RepID=A0A4S4EGK6_CAMSN|nr:hypothetical protein TEA_018964 [Camellia sinensis var. sinensis]
MCSPLSLLLSVIFIIITTTTAHFSTASPDPHTIHQLRPIVRQQSTIAAANGVAVRVELWCVGKNNAQDSALQKALDWACGPGGADCGPIQQGGPCYDPADVQRTASYAFNDYFLKNGLTQDSCNFDGTAALTSLNPNEEEEWEDASLNEAEDKDVERYKSNDDDGDDVLGDDDTYCLVVLNFMWTIKI